MDDDINERIEKLKREAAALSGGKMVTGFAPNCPPEIQEQFWKNVLAFENAPEVQPFDELVRAGLTLPPAGELDDVADLQAAWHIQMYAAGTDDDGVDAYLTYYADDETRREFAEKYPDCPVPERRELAVDRDRHLPSPWASGEPGSSPPIVVLLPV